MPKKTGIKMPSLNYDAQERKWNIWRRRWKSLWVWLDSKEGVSLRGEEVQGQMYYILRHIVDKRRKPRK